MVHKDNPGPFPGVVRAMILSESIQTVIVMRWPRTNKAFICETNCYWLTTLGGHRTLAGVCWFGEYFTIMVLKTSMCATHCYFCWWRSNHKMATAVWGSSRSGVLVHPVLNLQYIYIYIEKIWMEYWANIIHVNMHLLSSRKRKEMAIILLHRNKPLAASLPQVWPVQMYLRSHRSKMLSGDISGDNAHVEVCTIRVRPAFITEDQVAEAGSQWYLAQVVRNGNV